MIDWPVIPSPLQLPSDARAPGPAEERRGAAPAAGFLLGGTALPRRSRLVLAARLLSSVGDGLVFVAFPLLATRLTRSPVLIAGVAFMATVPWVVFGLPAGAIVDRTSRRRLLLAVEASRMIVMVLLGAAIVTHHLVLGEVYAAAFLVASGETLFDAASMAVIPQLAVHGDLVGVNSRMQVAQLGGEQFIGPAIGGLLFAAAASIPAFADGASFAASAALLALALRPVRRRGRHGRPRPGDSFLLQEPLRRTDRPHLLREVRVGLQWLAREERLRLVTALITSFAFFQGLGLAVLVIYCTRVLHLSVGAFGLFIAIAESGNAIGAWCAPIVHGRLGAGRTLLVAGGVGGIALVTVGVTSSVVVALGALWIEAIAVGIGNVASLALRQRLTPLELAGRVSSAIRTCIRTSIAVASLCGGALVVLVGIRAPFAVGGTAQIVAAVVIGGALARRLAADEDVVDLTDWVDLREDAAVGQV